jgi:hypothetical protein
LIASHGPSIVTSVSMSMDGQDGPLSSFVQFVIRIDLNLGGISFKLLISEYDSDSLF